MTKEEFEKLPFRYVSHLAMEDEHCMVLDCETIPYLGKCIHTPYKKGIPYGRSYTHYKYNGIVYKSLDKLLEVL